MCFKNEVSGEPFCIFKHNILYSLWEVMEKNYLVDPPRANICEVKVTDQMMELMVSGEAVVESANISKHYEVVGDERRLKEEVTTVFWATHGDGKYLPEEFKVNPVG